MFVCRHLTLSYKVRSRIFLPFIALMFTYNKLKLVSTIFHILAKEEP